MKSLIAVLIAINGVGCTASEPPTSFGVNLQIHADMLSADQRGRVESLRVTVTGDIPDPYVKTFAVTQAIGGGDIRAHYVPKQMSGALVFQAAALDSAAVVIAATTAVPVMLVAGEAVSVELTLLLNSNDDLGGDAGDMAVLKTQSESCSSSAECGTGGGCVDGRCCDQLCNGACSSCAVPGLEGKCSPIVAGSPSPSGHPSCPIDAKDSCGHDGLCDGQGACRLYPLGTTCKPSSCDAGFNLLTPSSTCDGKGSCVTPARISCAPFTCKDPDTCWTACTTNSQCTTPNVCSNQSCGPKPDGQACTQDGECQHSHCVDGVCCDSACTGPCQTCNQSASLGKCTVVAVRGGDPRSACPAKTGNDSTCTPGGCDGTANQCAKANAGTMCGAACSNGIPVIYSCDAVGTCSTTTQGSPCPAATCYSSSTVVTYSCQNGQCVSGAYSCPTNHFCSGGMCI